MGVQPGETIVNLAMDEHQPERISCATNGGEIFSSEDAGESWRSLPALPEGQLIYALAQA